MKLSFVQAVNGMRENKVIRKGIVVYVTTMSFSFAKNQSIGNEREWYLAVQYFPNRL